MSYYINNTMSIGSDPFAHYYGEMTHYGLYRLAWADVRRAR